MKRICIFFLALAGLAYFGLLPFRAHDVAQLLPVETVIVTRDGGQYCVDIGAGVRAVGRTLSEALDRLQEQVSGVLFFQTAEQVIVTEAAADAIPAVAEQARFRPAAGLYSSPEAPDAHAVSDYLKTRSASLTVGEAKAALAEGRTPQPPRIVPAGGGYRLLA